MRALAFLVALALAGAAAASTPRERLEAARKAFREGQFEQARDGYNSLVHPHVELADSNDLVEAYVNLGVCRVETGDDGGAREEFEKALEIDPNRQLDPKVITSERAIKLFDDTKADLRDRARRDEDKRKEAQRLEALEKIRKSAVGVRENNYVLTFVPFGVGQYQNGDIPKALFFLSAGVLTAGTSIGIFSYLLNKYGIRSDQVPREEGLTVRRLQQIEVGTGIAFYGIWVLGAIDANLHFKRQIRTKLDDELLQQIFPELRELDKKPKPKKTSFRDRLYLTPMATQSGVGLGIGWEN